MLEPPAVTTESTVHQPEPRPSASRPEALDAADAVRRIAAALPPVERAYSIARFAIIRSKLMTLLHMALPERGRVLDIGCGFGLWSAYLTLMAPERRMTGVDPNGKRVQTARALAQRLGLANNRYFEGTVETAPLDGEGPFDAIFMLDVMHHVPRESQRATLERAASLLAPKGVLVIKDITTDRPFGLKFTEWLDRLMVGFDEPLAYRHHNEWRDELESLGFSVRTVRIEDVLPYPHAMIVGQRG